MLRDLGVITRLGNSRYCVYLAYLAYLEYSEIWEYLAQVLGVFGALGDRRTRSTRRTRCTCGTQSIWSTRSVQGTKSIRSKPLMLWKPFLKGERTHICDISRTPRPPMWHHRGPRIFKNVWKWSQMTPGCILDRPNKCQTSVWKSSEVLLKISFDYPRSSPKSPRRLQTITKKTSNKLPKKVETMKAYSLESYELIVNNPSISMDYFWLIHRYGFWN